MLKNLTIHGEASYPPAGALLADLKQINFIYGANGSGKTTLSKVIANEGKYPNCKLHWEAGKQVSCFVYNGDFVREHFHNDPHVKGIFTFGDGAGDATKIAVEKIIEKVEEASGSTPAACSSMRR